MKTLQGPEAHYRLDQLINQSPSEHGDQDYLIRGRKNTVVVMTLNRWRQLIDSASVLESRGTLKTYTTPASANLTPSKGSEVSNQAPQRHNARPQQQRAHST